MNRKFGDIDSFLVFLEEKGAQTIAAMNETVEVSSSLLFDHAYELYGKNPPLADLAPSTQADRVRRGYTPNDPLLRTGALLRDQVVKSIKRVERRGLNDVASASVGSPEMINLYHEMGYRNARTGRPVPPRPVFLLTAKTAGPKLAELFSGEVKRVFGG